MAARSPIILDTPSPTVSELPPITPQQQRKSSTVATDSSPGLLSISKLVKHTNSGLISGSRVQEVPQGAKAGFASAASLWKAQKLEAGTKTASQQDEGTSVHQRLAKEISIAGDNAGKLPRRRKTDGTTRTAREPSISAQSPLSAFAYRGGDERARSISASPAPARSINADSAELQDQQPVRMPSISLAEYDFRPEEHGAVEAEDLPEQVVKKPRKSRANEGEANPEGPVKKPRKRTVKTAETGEGTKRKSRQPLKKSESVILNSDDLAATQANTYSRIEIPSPPPKARKTKKTTAKPARITEQDVILTVDDTTKETFEKSSYFAGATEQQIEGAIDDTEATKDVFDVTGFARESTPRSPVLPQVAPRRRLSWTSAKKIATETLGGHEPAPAVESDEETTTRSLADLVSGFGYASGSAFVPPTAGQRSASGESLTKRRRIDLAEEATKAPTRRRPSPRPGPADKPQKVKAPKKKPQTITDLATKAYRAPEEEVAEAQQTVSDFFSAQKADSNPAVEAIVNQAAVKPKKPRKPRAKKADADGSKPESALKTAKAKKAKKVRIVEDDYLANLHTPGQARAQERSQDFLFGTSSQLGVDDSPTIIRDMQMAVRESEVIPPSQIDSPKSRARVTRSHDSSGRISNIEAKKDLWCTAARDTDGDVMRLDSATIRIVQAREKLIIRKPVEPALPVPLPTKQEESISHDPPPTKQEESISHHPPAQALPLPDPAEGEFQDAKASVELPVIQDPPPAETENITEQVIVDLCHTSPIAEDADAALPTVPELPRALDMPSPKLTAQSTALNAAEPQSDDVWAIIPSDSSPRDQADERPVPSVTGMHSPSKLPQKVVPLLKRSATSPIRQRSALQALDANISSLHHTSPGKGLEAAQQRAHSSKAASDQLKRPRGRPKKSTDTDDASSAPPKKRGRPRKADTLTASPKRAGLGISASQPVGSGSSAFANIDEISDPDSPNTPSPPRRRAMSSPPEVRPLEFDVAESPSKLTMPRTTLLTLKPGDDYFVTAIQPSLFPQITDKVRSAPPSNSLSNPSWHEKILLYDPIVLEDFTAWLNEQGLTIELQRLKAKPKTKGRKKKDADPVPDEPEYETINEELKPWMVQKWCEEKSVCCLWKEGLRGGVRTRY